MRSSLWLSSLWPFDKAARLRASCLRNCLDYVPRKADDDCQQELRWLYARRNLAEAQDDVAAWLTRWQRKYPKLTDCVEENIGSS